jgi:hypothetical protein
VFWPRVGKLLRNKELSCRARQKYGEMRRAREYTPHCFCKCAETIERKEDGPDFCATVCAKCAQTIGKMGDAFRSLQRERKSGPKSRAFLVRGTRTTPLPLFFVSMEFKGLRGVDFVSMDSKGLNGSKTVNRDRRPGNRDADGEHEAC